MKISPWLLPHGIAMDSKWDNEILYTESSESYKLLYWRQSYLLLLFSHFVVSDSLAIPWAIAWASQVALVVICLPMHEMQEMWVWSLGREDSLEKGTATHSSILAWRISWTEDPGGLQSIGLHRVSYDWNDLACTHAHTDYSLPGSSVHGTSQERILEWVAISFSRGSSQTQGLNPHLLRWQAHSLPLSHQGSPELSRPLQRQLAFNYLKEC